MGPRLLHILVLNGTAAPQVGASELVTFMEQWPDPFAVLTIDGDVGYVEAVRQGLDISRVITGRLDRVGFLDADTRLEGLGHWTRLETALDAEPELDAISGLVVHQRCGIWETPSSQRFITALTRQLTVVDKPYIQGGAGGTLARRGRFEEAVACAQTMGTLIGPSLSAAAIAGGRAVRATGHLPCRHTPRVTLADWTTSVSAYERSWGTLLSRFGRSVEQPWAAFLETARQLLAADPDLLRDLDYSITLRRQIADDVARQLDIHPAEAL
ncbi:hypothetical protein R8Z50_22425 [Longispora sp. K20-0274]|uniref:hypothetical protein n=1 Tax=Longispora sp. K20-0274 TaxID=3088255 RepID=UPI003999B060